MEVQIFQVLISFSESIVEQNKRGGKKTEIEVILGRNVVFFKQGSMVSQGPV